jgi:hypothetical protein
MSVHADVYHLACGTAGFLGLMRISQDPVTGRPGHAMNWIIVLLLILLTASVADATERFVDLTLGKNCTNYNPSTRLCSGGKSVAYKTAQAAFNATVPGDMVTLRAGTYTETYDANIGLSMSFSSPSNESERVTIRNYSGEVATYRPNGPCGRGDFYMLYGTSKSYVTIDGMNGRSTPGGIVFDGSNCSTGSGTNKSAIVFQGAGNGNENNFNSVQGVEFYHIQSVGVYVEGTDAYVGHNKFYDSTGAYPVIWSQAVYLRGNTKGTYSGGGDRGVIEFNEVYNYNVNDGGWGPRMLW